MSDTLFILVLLLALVVAVPMLVLGWAAVVIAVLLYGPPYYLGRRS